MVPEAKEEALAVPQGEERVKRKRPLSQELEEDSVDEDADGGQAVARVGNRFAGAPNRHEIRGRRLGIVWNGRRWDFWEVCAGRAEYSEAVASLGYMLGPSVDNKPLSRHGATVSRLVLDLTNPEDVEFLWWILTTMKQRFVTTATAARR